MSKITWSISVCLLEVTLEFAITGRTICYKQKFEAAMKKKPEMFVTVLGIQIRMTLRPLQYRMHVLNFPIYLPRSSLSNAAGERICYKLKDHTRYNSSYSNNIPYS
jgi:hypothetical protein